MAEDKSDACPSCGKPYAVHLGLIGTCARLRDAEAVAEAADEAVRDDIVTHRLIQAVQAWRKQRGKR